MADSGSDQTPLVRIRNLSIRIGSPQVEAVKAISFDIHQGEILGLAGESGSGKSVSAMALARLLPKAARPQVSGCVSLSGESGNLLQLGPSRLRKIRSSRIAYVFQEPSSSFNPAYSIRNHLEEILNGAGIPKPERDGAIRNAFAQVGIAPTKDHLESYPGDFSGGMLQRMAIACALAPQPDLLIADEPSTALDTTSQKRIVELLQALNQQAGMAILFISHDLALLKQIAGRLLVMQDGEIVEEGNAEKLLYQPEHPYTRRLVAAIPKLQIDDPTDTRLHD
jgi:ABC-type glutathione transport system ATPase component